MEETKLSFEEWYDQNIEALEIEFAESGFDRELDYHTESEKEIERRYQKYLNDTGS